MPIFDSAEPAGTSLNPLGWEKGSSSATYLLGLACTCGRRSLVAADALERPDDLECPACGASLR